MAQEVASFDLLNENETEIMGQCLARCLPKAFTACFKGQLGVGKTTLIRAMIREWGVTGPIKSPTFSMVESYQAAHVIHHFDLYRLSEPQELEMMGFRDYFSSDTICLIEWPERASTLLANVDLVIDLLPKDVFSRQMTLYAQTPAGQAVLTCLSRSYG